MGEIGTRVLFYVFLHSSNLSRGALKKYIGFLKNNSEIALRRVIFCKRGAKTPKFSPAAGQKDFIDKNLLVKRRSATKMPPVRVAKILGGKAPQAPAGGENFWGYFGKKNIHSRVTNPFPIPNDHSHDRAGH